MGELPVGTKVFAQAFYWDREVELAGEIVGVSLVAGQLELRLQAGGTSDEGLCGCRARRIDVSGATFVVWGVRTVQSPTTTST